MDKLVIRNWNGFYKVEGQIVGDVGVLDLGAGRYSLTVVRGPGIGCLITYVRGDALETAVRLINEAGIDWEALSYDWRECDRAELKRLGAIVKKWRNG